MDIIERLNDPEMYADAVDDAIREIERLRERVAELETTRSVNSKNTIAQSTPHGNALKPIQA